jgi:hypothetical protein
MTETDLDTAILRKGYAEYSKEIAGGYVKPLLSENILQVSKDHIKIRNLIVSRERVVFLHIALTQLRSPATMYPVRQGVNGFTVEKVKAARGNDVVDAYRITSNASDHTSILLTKKLAWELWEVIAFFIPSWEAPLDNPLPKTTYFGDREESPRVEDPEPENFSDDDEDFEDDQENDDEGPITFDYTPFPAGSVELSNVIWAVLDKFVKSPPSETFTFDGNVIEHSSTGMQFVIVSSNESEHVEWDEGHPFGDMVVAVSEALNAYSVETYNEPEEFLDDDFVADYETDEVE